MSDLRSLPKIDQLSESPDLGSFSRAIRTSAARAAVDELREAIRAGGLVDLSTAPELARRHAERLSAASLRPAINMSGVVLHTGLGRARLAGSVAEQVARVARQHAIVEFEEETGKRGDRQTHVRELICRLTGAEDALVVNNAAAAVFLTLSALCSGREVVLSRGQMVEIGGSFRMPDIVRQSGCRLVEVGCTNKTRLSDFEGAISQDSSAFLRCHPSNFRIVGFTEEPALSELSELAHAHELICIDDQGNGCLVDLSQYGLPREQTLTESISGGADVAMASGDKLLGGPQAGLIVGRKDLIARIKRHPLARAVRIDKLTLAALEATLRLYVEDQWQELPVYRYLGRPLDEVRFDAERLASAYAGDAVIESGLTEVGGGSAPASGVPTVRVGLKGSDVEALARNLRTGTPPIVARIERDLVWLDPRTAEPDEISLVCEKLATMG